MADPDDDSVKIALLAHDLRTPLAAMRLTAELIGNRPLDPVQQEHLSILVRSIDALTQLTGDLIPSGSSGGGSGSSRVGDILSDVAGLFRIAAEAKGLSFDVSLEPAVKDIVTARGGALRRVLTTLLDNAVKYTPEGGISLAAWLPPSGPDGREMVALTVVDSGPGIDPEEQARLFRPFVRGRHGRETGPGTGLGLWGAQQLLQEMGGQMDLSRPAAGGSRFEVRIPVDAIATGGPGTSVAPACVRGPSRPASGLSAHVLIVDDNDTNCRLLEALLESFGISSEIARSGEQAIGLVGKSAFDAVLLDLHMPGMSGMETAEELRHLRPEADLPLIAVTAALESVDDDRLRQAGFRDVLTKPLSPAALYEAMGLVLGKSSEAGSLNR
ncbi:response regulator [Labrenzia sp. 011]|uniref:ATP-binding response regulator n=1 Tax=Labrenzia sp. 011 TaxID=2171494 RepID=UPI000D50722E|nr:response regulator [Labrenzia sp. 011]PVB61210.1 hybrid sensor histidine kinase/response regulator [Labrenzia sp. 011]